MSRISNKAIVKLIKTSSYNIYSYIIINQYTKILLESNILSEFMINNNMILILLFIFYIIEKSNNICLQGYNVIF